jgi:hypothetical protein
MLAPVGALAGKSPPADPVPPANLRSYTGIYQNDYYGPADIQLHNSGLVMKIGPQDQEFPLQHWNGDIFTYIPNGENAPDGSRAALTFTRNAAAFTNDLYPGGGNQFVRQ